jgi:hypothetical protein
MVGSRFDAWTRRRLGVAAVAWLGLLPEHEAAAKRKRKKRKRQRARSRKCEPLGTDCNPHNDKRLCCGDTICGQADLLGGRRCCHDRHGICQRDADCCNNMKCMSPPDGFCDT